VDIEAPPESVWPVMSGVERWHEWTASITGVERLDAGPFAPGARARVRQPGLPPAEWKVTALEPGRSFTWESRAPGVHVTAHHEVAAMAGGTRATLWIDYAGVLGKLIGRLTRGINERYLAMEAEGLKRRGEGRG